MLFPLTAMRIDHLVTFEISMQYNKNKLQFSFATVGQSVRSNKVTESAYSAGRQGFSEPLTVEKVST